MRDTRNILLLLLSGGLVSTWAYYLYDKSQQARKPVTTLEQVAGEEAARLRDSLAAVYGHTIRGLDERLDSTRLTAGALQETLEQKVGEIVRLRNEIAALLQKTSLSRDDLSLARQKTTELQERVNALQENNASLETEKQRISEAFATVNDQVKTLEANVQQLSQENRRLQERMAQAATFEASDIKLMPVTVRNDKERETNLAARASKLVISFTVQSNVTDKTEDEVYVIVTQPDGTVLKTDVWESFSVQTRQEGLRSYTRKLRFDYQKGQPRHLLFSLSPENYLAGTYQVELYHNGYRIGRKSTILN